MEALATVVFERTPMGSVAIGSAGVEVPRRLRTLLLAVDGRSAVEKYVPFLTAFLPLSEKFAELERLGYLRRRNHADGNAEGRSERSQTAALTATPARIEATPFESVSAALDEAALSAFAASMGNPITRLNPVDDAFSLELKMLSRQLSGKMLSDVMQPENGSALKLPDMQPFTTAAAGAVLSDALTLMEQFLSRCAGLDGLPIAMMFEQIKSLDQLRSELPAYFQLIEPYGREAQLHIAELTQLLD